MALMSALNPFERLLHQAVRRLGEDQGLLFARQRAAELGIVEFIRSKPYERCWKFQRREVKFDERH
jgi:hypothetical protein